MNCWHEVNLFAASQDCNKIKEWLQVLFFLLLSSVGKKRHKSESTDHTDNLTILACTKPKTETFLLTFYICADNTRLDNVLVTASSNY